MLVRTHGLRFPDSQKLPTSCRNVFLSSNRAFCDSRTKHGTTKHTRLSARRDWPLDRSRNQSEYSSRSRPLHLQRSPLLLTARLRHALPLLRRKTAEGLYARAYYRLFGAQKVLDPATPKPTHNCNASPVFPQACVKRSSYKSVTRLEWNRFHGCTFTAPSTSYSITFFKQVSRIVADLL